MKKTKQNKIETKLKKTKPKQSLQTLWQNVILSVTLITEMTTLKYKANLTQFFIKRKQKWHLYFDYN